MSRSFVRLMAHLPAWHTMFRWSSRLTLLIPPAQRYHVDLIKDALNPSLHPTCFSALRLLPHAGELEHEGSSGEARGIKPWPATRFQRYAARQNRRPGRRPPQSPCR